MSENENDLPFITVLLLRSCLATKIEEISLARTAR